jgi:tetratricopeptide (TPR) repeat protein
MVTAHRLSVAFLAVAAACGLAASSFAAELIMPQPVAASASSASAAATASAPAPGSPADMKRQQTETALSILIGRCYDLIEAGKAKTALTEAMQARSQLKDVRTIQLETLIGRLAVIEKAPDKALEFVAPYTRERTKYDDDIGLASIVSGDAYLAQTKNLQALEVFDWVAGKAEGKTLVLAAEGCGKALMAMKEHAKAADSLDFALNYARQKDNPSDPYTGLIKRIQPLYDKARRLADIDLFGEDFVLYRDAERLRRLEKNFKAAREVYEDVIARFPDGPYAEPSQLYGAMCLVELNKVPQAEKELAAMRQANPYGLYSGEALLTMGRLALEYHLEPGPARGCFALLDTWIEEVKSKPPLLAVEKLSHRKDAAVKVTTPPAQEKYVDFWGNVKKSEIKPGMLVNPKTCPWYLDDLTEQSAMYQGFLFFTEGKKDEAMAQYKRILDLDPATRQMNVSGEANDYMRLKVGVDNGYLVAFPEELALYKGPRQRLAVLLADFDYVCQRFDQAASMTRRLLRGEVGALTGVAREYPQLLYAKCTYWSAGRTDAFSEYMKVARLGGGGFQTFTQCRAAFCAGNIARQAADKKVQQAGHDLLGRLATCSLQNRFVCEARIRYAQNLIEMGRRKEGIQILETFPTWSKCYKQEADYWLQWYQVGQDKGK